MSKPFYLNGRWVSSSWTQDVINPWSGERIEAVDLAVAAQVEEAVATAHAAFVHTRRISAVDRNVCLRRVADGISARKEEFIATMVGEAGKPYNFAKVEVERAIISFEQAAHETVQAAGELLEMGATKPGAGHFGMVRRFPIGVVLGITPFNFPLNLVAHKVAPVIATGNTMILKPALKTPLTSLLLAEVLHDAGVPEGQVNVVPFDHEFIPRLLIDERVKMLSFTGSVGVGWKLKTEAAKMKVALELGGNAAVVVEPETFLETAIPKIANGAFGYAGQSCISVQRILVHRSIYDEFRAQLVSYIKEKVKVGDPSDVGTVVGPMINASARDKVVDWIQQAEKAGATLLTPVRTEGINVLHPVLLEHVPLDAAVSCEEAFAPLAVLESYETFDGALARVNDSRFGLQAGVFTLDVKKAFQAFETLEVGGVMINQVPTFRVENMPYGGVKDSGLGREGICYAMEDMTEPRALVMNLG
jgi:acyl-CoA reductase-like NAD-dependent aldehyde dehydrogenase